MKILRFLLLVVLLFITVSFANAEQITVTSTTITGVQFQGNTCTVRIYASANFFTSDNLQIIGGAVGSQQVYKSVACTIASTTLTIPQFTIDSTTDSIDNRIVKYNAVIYDKYGTLKIYYLQNFAVPTSLGTTVSWAQLRLYNAGTKIPSPPITYLNNEQVSAAIAAAFSTFEDVIAGLGAIAKLSCYNPSEPVYGSASGADAVDDTAAISAAVTAASNAGGGYVCLSSGTWRTTGNIALPDNVAVVGGMPNAYATAGVYSGGTTILLTASSASVFTVGENTEGITIKDLNLQANTSLTNTNGIKMSGAYPNSSQIFNFDSLTFGDFTRGIYVLGTDLNKDWQASYVRLENSTFRVPAGAYGLWLETNNTEWSIRHNKFYLGAGAYGYMGKSSGMLLFENNWFLGPAGVSGCTSVGASPGYTPTYNAGLAESGIYIDGPHSAVIVKGGQAEQVKYGLVQNYDDLNYPVTLDSAGLGDIRLNGDTTFISRNNSHFSNAVEAYGNTQIYSYGDTVFKVGGVPYHKCYAADTSGVNFGFILHESAGIITQTSTSGVANSQLNVGALYPVLGSDYIDSTKPILGIAVDAGYPHKNLLRIGLTSNKVWTNYYDFSRNSTTGFVDILGSQSLPYRGININGQFQMASSSAQLSEAGKGTFYFDTSSNLFKVSENAGSFKNLPKWTSFTNGRNAIWSATDGTLTSGLLEDNGSTRISLTTGDLLLASGFSRVLDANANTLFTFGHTSKAVNYFRATNSATLNNLKLEALGSDINISLSLVAKGAGGVAVIEAGGAYRNLRVRGIQFSTDTRPACDASIRGMQWYVAGGAGVKDTLTACAKDASDVYDWRILY